MLPSWLPSSAQVKPSRPCKSALPASLCGWGGLGLRSAERLRFAAHWGSWANCLPVLHARSPLLGDRLLQLLQGEARPQPPCIQAACVGDHRTACATSGVLRSRAVPLQRALARVCREAGARVAANVPLSRMNLPLPPADSRQIEILANGYSLIPLRSSSMAICLRSTPSSRMRGGRNTLFHPLTSAKEKKNSLQPNSLLPPT